MTAPRVGDVVAWADVPDGALVRWRDVYLCFQARRVFQVYYPGVSWLAPEGEGNGRDRWAHMVEARATIIALGLTGQESADDLRRLAEVFEVRECLYLADHPFQDLESRKLPKCSRLRVGNVGYFIADSDDLTWTAERLHAAGWRPGMTAEDAVGLLAQAGGAS